VAGVSVTKLLLLLLVVAMVVRDSSVAELPLPAAGAGAAMKTFPSLVVVSTTTFSFARANVFSLFSASGVTVMLTTSSWHPSKALPSSQRLVG